MATRAVQNGPRETKQKEKKKIKPEPEHFFQANVPLDGEKACFAQRSHSNYEWIHARSI